VKFVKQNLNHVLIVQKDFRFESDNTMNVVSKLREWFLHNVLKFLTLYAEDRNAGIAGKCE